MSARIHFIAPAKFESKSQIAPNAIVFHRDLSDAAVRLILAFNAIFSCTKTWTILQCDIQKRLGWGRDKMRAAIKECIEHGFMRVRQSRRTDTGQSSGHKKGSFSHNEFDFDIDASFATSKDVPKHDECPHNESGPLTGNPSSENPSSENKALPCSLDKPSFKKEPTNAKAASAAVVVVPSNQEEEAKRAALSPYSLPESMIVPCLSLELSHITDAIAAYEQYAAGQKAKGINIDKPAVALKTAIIGGWKPNFTKQDKINAIEEEKDKKAAIIKSNYDKAKSLEKIYYKRFGEDFGFYISDNVVQLKYKRGQYPLGMLESDFISQLESYIEKNCPK